MKMMPAICAVNARGVVPDGQRSASRFWAARSMQLPGVPAQVVAQARSSVAIATHLGGSVAVGAHSAFLSGMHVAFRCAAGALVVAAAGVITLLGSRETECTVVVTVADSHQTVSRV